MKLFKTQNNEIYAYEEDGSQDDLIGDKTPITQEEADSIISYKIVLVTPKEQEIINARQSALSKLIALGLTDLEIQALLG